MIIRTADEMDTKAKIRSKRNIANSFHTEEDWIKPILSTEDAIEIVITMDNVK